MDESAPLDTSEPSEPVSHGDEPSPVQQLEAMRLEAEIRKLRAEASRIEGEAERERYEAALPWYRSKRFYRLLAASLVLVPVAWFYIKELIVPMMQAENARISRELEIERTKLEELAREADTREQSLNAKNAGLVHEQAQLAREINLLEQERTEFEQIKNEELAALRADLEGIIASDEVKGGRLQEIQMRLAGLDGRTIEEKIMHAVASRKGMEEDLAACIGREKERIKSVRRRIMNILNRQLATVESPSIAFASLEEECTLNIHVEKIRGAIWDCETTVVLELGGSNLNLFQSTDESCLTIPELGRLVSHDASATIAELQQLCHEAPTT